MKIKVEQEVESCHFQFNLDNSLRIYTVVVLSDYQDDKEVLVHWHDYNGKLSNAYYSKECVEANIKSGLWGNIKALDLK